MSKKLFLCILLIAHCSLFIGAQTLSLDETLEALGGAANVQFRWDPFFASGTITSGRYEASFRSGNAGETGTVLLDRREVLTLPLPYLERGVLRFPHTFVTEVRNTFARYSEESLSRFRIGAIIIDPGHGGRDPGTVWTYEVDGRPITIMEKDIVLNVSRLLYASLSASFPDRQILLTRRGDYLPTREDRVRTANSVPLAPNEMAIFISVHANSSLSNRNARGFEVWYLNPNHRRNVLDRSQRSESAEVISILNTMMEEQLTTLSILMANNILRRMDETVGHISPNRGLKAHNWFQVRDALVPSVLVELGFVSNREEALLMTDPAYLRKLSDALYKGISDFVRFFERTGGLAAAQ